MFDASKQLERESDLTAKKRDCWQPPEWPILTPTIQCMLAM
jgi:hypothetical protein